jgi:hypothetical protein
VSCSSIFSMVALNGFIRRCGGWSQKVRNEHEGWEQKKSWWLCLLTVSGLYRRCEYRRARCNTLIYNCEIQTGAWADNNGSRTLGWILEGRWRGCHLLFLDKVHTESR